VLYGTKCTSCVHCVQILWKQWLCSVSSALRGSTHCTVPEQRLCLFSAKDRLFSVYILQYYLMICTCCKQRLGYVRLSTKVLEAEAVYIIIKTQTSNKFGSGVSVSLFSPPYILIQLKL